MSAAVAHRMQEEAFGALKSAVRHQLMQAANNPATSRPSTDHLSRPPRAGTVLVRDCSLGLLVDALVVVQLGGDLALVLELLQRRIDRTPRSPDKPRRSAPPFSRYITGIVGESRKSRRNTSFSEIVTNITPYS